MQTEESANYAKYGCPAGKYCDNDICDYREQHRKAVTSRNNPMQTESKPKWEEEFDKEFGKYDTAIEQSPDSVKSFIRHTIAEVIDEIQDDWRIEIPPANMIYGKYFKQQLRDKYL